MPHQTASPPCHRVPGRGRGTACAHDWLGEPGVTRQSQGHPTDQGCASAPPSQIDRACLRAAPGRSAIEGRTREQPVPHHYPRSEHSGEGRPWRGHQSTRRRAPRPTSQSAPPDTPCDPETPRTGDRSSANRRTSLRSPKSTPYRHSHNITSAAGLLSRHATTRSSMVYAGFLRVGPRRRHRNQLPTASVVRLSEDCGRPPERQAVVRHLGHDVHGWGRSRFSPCAFQAPRCWCRIGLSLKTITGTEAGRSPVLPADSPYAGGTGLQRRLGRLSPAVPRFAHGAFAASFGQPVMEYRAAPVGGWSTSCVALRGLAPAQVRRLQPLHFEKSMHTRILVQNNDL